MVGVGIWKGASQTPSSELQPFSRLVPAMLPATPQCPHSYVSGSTGCEGLSVGPSREEVVP